LPINRQLGIGEHKNAVGPELELVVNRVLILVVLLEILDYPASVGGVFEQPFTQALKIGLGRLYQSSSASVNSNMHSHSLTPRPAQCYPSVQIVSANKRAEKGVIRQDPVVDIVRDDGIVDRAIAGNAIRGKGFFFIFRRRDRLGVLSVVFITVLRLELLYRNLSCNIVNVLEGGIIRNWFFLERDELGDRLEIARED